MSRAPTLIHVGPGIIHENVAKGLDQPVISVDRQDGSAPELSHRVLCHCPGCGKLAATIESDMTTRPRKTPHSWAEALGPVTTQNRGTD